MVVQISRILIISALFADNIVPAFAQSNEFASVYGVLQRSCFECHGPEKQEGELRLDRSADLTDSGTVVAGEPDNSELLRRITLPKTKDEVMPAIGDTL